MASVFPTIQDWENYVNTNINANGRKDITGPEANKSFQGAIQFIPEYTVNAQYGSKVFSTGGNVVLGRAVNIITVVPPVSITWSSNIQKEYYIVNTTSSNIPLSGVTYYDFSLQVKDYIPLLSVVHLAQSENGLWIQINNLGGEASDVPNEKEDTSAIAINLSGTLNRKIEAELNLSEEEGNVAEIREDGLFVPTPAAPPSGALTGDL